MAVIIPQKYKLKLLPETTEIAIKDIKMFFQDKLSDALNLRRVTAPLFVLSGTGLNDDLNGVEKPVGFDIKALGGQHAEVVHSLAKWKRTKLADYDIAPGFGLYTDMNAIRADEDLDNLHSLYVDQWDWERTIEASDRNLPFLKDIVTKIYQALLDTEEMIYHRFPHITPTLPREITFVHAADLQRQFPDLTPKQREVEITKKYGAVFIIGIGDTLADGKPHDGRAPDYDDWSTDNGEGSTGLNGDILVWNTVLQCPFELSSMGIRVDKEALLRQLDKAGCPQRANLKFHKALLDGKLPLSIGGGIGQSRLCMFILQKAHIGEVQASIWPQDQIDALAKAGIRLI